MEERQRLEIGERITSLRERSPHTQPELAERLGIGLRAYQKLEKEGTTRYERCQELAEIHSEWATADPGWAFVSPGWLWDGKERPEIPDLMDSLTDASQLTRMEQKLDLLLASTEARAVREAEDALAQGADQGPRRDADTGD